MSYSWNHIVSGFCDLFHMVTCSWVASKTHHGSIAHFFLVLDNIALSGWTTAYLFTYWNTSWLPLATVEETAVTSLCKFSCGHTFSTSLGKYQKAQLLDHMMSMFDRVWNHQIVFQSGSSVRAIISLISHRAVSWPKAPKLASKSCSQNSDPAGSLAPILHPTLWSVAGMRW